jgi:hypothetical protein
VLQLVILSFLLQVLNGAPNPVSEPTGYGSIATGELHAKSIWKYSYSIVITPEAIKEVPESFNTIDYLREMVQSYSKEASNAVEKLEMLEEEAKEKKFVVPERFINSNLKAARDLNKVLVVKVKEFFENLKKLQKVDENLKEKIRVIGLLTERIELLYLSSHDFYIRTTNFIPFEIKVIKR